MGFILEIMKKKNTRWHYKSEISKRNVIPWYLHYYSASRDGLSFKRSGMIHLSSSSSVCPLFSSQNWTNFDNIPTNSNFSQDFVNFVGFLMSFHFGWIKQQTKQTNYSSLRLSASMDTKRPPGWYNSAVKEILARNPSV